jgi:hypothetical protein
VPDVLSVAALELGHPLALFIPVVSDDALLHQARRRSPSTVFAYCICGSLTLFL